MKTTTYCALAVLASVCLATDPADGAELYLSRDTPTSTDTTIFTDTVSLNWQDASGTPATAPISSSDICHVEGGHIIRINSRSYSPFPGAAFHLGGEGLGKDGTLRLAQFDWECGNLLFHVYGRIEASFANRAPALSGTIHLVDPETESPREYLIGCTENNITLQLAASFVSDAADAEVLLLSGVADCAFVIAGDNSEFNGRFTTAEGVSAEVIVLASDTALGNPSRARANALELGEPEDGAHSLYVKDGCSLSASRGIEIVGALKIVAADYVASATATATKTFPCSNPRLDMPIGGSRGFEKTGAGTLTLGGAYSAGDIVVSEGTLSVGKNATFSGGQTITVKSGATLSIRSSQLTGITVSKEAGATVNTIQEVHSVRDFTASETIEGDATAWSDSSTVHGSADYTITNTVKNIGNATSHAWSSLTVRPSAIEGAGDVRLLMRADCRLEATVMPGVAITQGQDKNGGNYTLSGAMELGTDPELEGCVTFSAKYNGGTNTLAAALSGAGDLLATCGDFGSEKVTGSNASGAVALAGDNSAWTGALCVTHPRSLASLDAGGNPWEKGVVLVFDSKDALGGPLASEPASGAVVLDRYSALAPQATMTFDTANRSVAMDRGVFEIPEGVSFEVANRICCPSSLYKTGAGRLDVARIDNTGEGAAVSLFVKGGTLALAGDAVSTTVASFADGATLAVRGDVALETGFAGIVSESGSPVQVVLDDGFELPASKSFEAVLATVEGGVETTFAYSGALPAGVDYARISKKNSGGTTKVIFRCGKSKGLAVVVR